MSEKVFEVRREYGTSGGTAVFGHYGHKGWLLEEIKLGHPTPLSEFKKLAKGIEELLDKLNKKKGRPKK